MKNASENQFHYTNTRKVSKTITTKTTFTEGDFVRVRGWHPYNVAYIEGFVGKNKVLVEHEGMYFTLHIRDLSKLVEVTY